MLHIYCPWCGEHREQEEFTPKGQAHLIRPQDPDNCTDEEWGNYLFFRDNPRGVHHEMWVHAAGCRKFFNVTRNTVTYEILETYKMGEQPAGTHDGDVLTLPVRPVKREDTVDADPVKVQAGGRS